MSSFRLAMPSDSEPSILRRFIQSLNRFLKKISGRSDNDGNLRETIEELIEESNEANPSIDHDERELLGNVLNLRDLTAQDVMIPRVDIIAVPQSVSSEELIATINRSHLKQILVYKENMDEVIGMVQVKDLLAWMTSNKNFNIKSLLREVLFVSPSLGTLDLILQMRESGTKVALVVDEFGGIDGLVTFSDLIEEIIGDIQDAQDRNAPSPLQMRSDGVIVADGRVTLEEINEAYQIDFMIEDLEDDIETIGGLVTSLAGRVPRRGEVITHPNGTEFVVTDADLRRVKRLNINTKSHKA